MSSTLAGAPALVGPLQINHKKLLTNLTLFDLTGALCCGNYRTWTPCADCFTRCPSFDSICEPPSSEYGTYKTVKARFRPWLSGKSP